MTEREVLAEVADAIYYAPVSLAAKGVIARRVARLTLRDADEREMFLGVALPAFQSEQEGETFVPLRGTRGRTVINVKRKRGGK